MQSPTLFGSTTTAGSMASPREQRVLGKQDIDGFVLVLRESSPLNPGQKKTTIEVKLCANTDDET
jgi:hypothetical protein